MPMYVTVRIRELGRPGSELSVVEDAEVGDLSGPEMQRLLAQVEADYPLTGHECELSVRHARFFAPGFE